MLGKAPDMNRKSWINHMLLAGASALAMTVASAEAGATTFDFTASLVSWTVPTNGVYVITAYGAQGGSNDFLAGGLGAEAGGYIPLSAGTMLAVIAGGEGALEAGGGGSFLSPLSGLADRVLLAGVNSGNGYVTIDLIAPPPAVPEPSTWTMMVVGFGSLAFALWRRRANVDAGRTRF
jgi:hypothetical protein